jgi:hypothetical protein
LPANAIPGLAAFCPSVNPKLPSGVVANAIAENKSKASAEFENIWREDIADFHAARHFAA